MDKKARKRAPRIPDALTRIPADALRGFLRGLVRDTYSVHLQAHHASRDLFGVSCARTDLLMLSGRDATDATGKISIKIDDLLCGSISEGLSPSILVMMREPNFVATPLGTAPTFATVQTSSTPRGDLVNVILSDRAGNPVQGAPIQNVTVDVTIWKPDSSAAANTAFSWICTIEAARALPIGG